jgi:hypothetical protein
MRGQNLKSVTGAPGAVGTLYESGVQIGQKQWHFGLVAQLVFRLYLAFQCAAKAQTW